MAVVSISLFNFFMVSFFNVNERRRPLFVSLYNQHLYNKYIIRQHVLHFVLHGILSVTKGMPTSFVLSTPAIYVGTTTRHYIYKVTDFNGSTIREDKPDCLMKIYYLKIPLASL